MDELEISGKRYISTRKAAKDNKYSSDYVGQLIRGKKVIGQKVGRSWYVEAKSLAIYLGKEKPEPETMQAPAVIPTVTVPVAPITQSSFVHAPVSVHVEQTKAAPPLVKTIPQAFTPAPVPHVTHDAPREVLHEARQVSRSQSDGFGMPTKAPALDDYSVTQKNLQHLETKPQEHEVQIKIEKFEVPTPKMVHRSGLVYLSENEETLPPLQKRYTENTATHKEYSDVQAAEETIVEAPRVVGGDAYNAPRSRAVGRIAFVIAGVLLLAVTAGASALLTSVTTVEQGKPASVGLSLK